MCNRPPTHEIPDSPLLPLRLRQAAEAPSNSCSPTARRSSSQAPHHCLTHSTGSDSGRGHFPDLCCLKELAYTQLAAPPGLQDQSSTESACPAEPFYVPISFMSAVDPPPPIPPAEQLARIIDGLCAAVAARGVVGLLTGPLILLLWGRLRRTALRVRRLAARIAAGTPLLSRQRPASPRVSRKPPPRLPRGYAWVVRLVPAAACSGTQLQALLTDPQMAALAEVPAMRRLLGPLCQMLGVPPSSLPKRRAEATAVAPLPSPAPLRPPAGPPPASLSSAAPAKAPSPLFSPPVAA